MTSWGIALFDLNESLFVDVDDFDKTVVLLGDGGLVFVVVLVMGIE